MKLIACVDNNWGLGYKNNLLVRIPEDMKLFKDITSQAGIIVMGRKTFESLPDKKPLKDRVNIIFTNNISYKVEGALVVHSMYEFANVMYENNFKSDNVIIIGGGKIYEAFYKLCNVAYITKVHRDFSEADTYLSNLDEDINWELVKESETFNYEGIYFNFCTYNRISYGEEI